MSLFGKRTKEAPEANKILEVTKAHQAQTGKIQETAKAL
jgi:hypothetical protein